ncbi:uncharacterized protein [Palaemon carinicauda]|uniref:uncharacterized protein n=1 Tax=Palaemon carinicauda TaxID=392227 RepID=UPI0035B65F20
MDLGTDSSNSGSNIVTVEPYPRHMKNDKKTLQKKRERMRNDDRTEKYRKVEVLPGHYEVVNYEKFFIFEFENARHERLNVYKANREIVAIRSPSNWKNFKQFIFLGHSRFVYDNSIPESEGVPTFQVLTDSNLKLDNLESVLRNHNVDFQRNTLLLSSIGIEDFLEIELSKTGDEPQGEDLSVADVVAKAKKTMKKLRRMFTNDSESYLINVLPVELRTSNLKDEISHLDLKLRNKINSDINDSIKAFNNYVKLSAPQKLKEIVPDFTNVPTDTDFINKYTSDGLNLTALASAKLSRVIATNVKHYISFKGIFRNVILVGDSHLENILRVWPGDRFNCTVFVIPSYKMTDIRVGSPLWRALKEYKNSLIILNLSILDLYDNEYISCPECKTTMKFLVPKTLSASREILLERFKGNMERVECVVLNSLDNCNVLFGHSHIIDVPTHHEHVIQQHNDTCDFRNVQTLFNPVSQESKTVISELFNLVESCNEYASVRNKSNWLPTWDKLPFIYGYEYKKSKLLPYCFPTDTFVDGINLSVGIARRIAEYFYFATEDIIKLTSLSERKNSKNSETTELEVSKKEAVDISKRAKITVERNIDVPIQINTEGRKPKWSAKTKEGDSNPLPSSLGFQSFNPSSLFSVRFDAYPPPPYHGGFVGHDITASTSSEYPLYGDVSASWNNQPSDCAPWNWPNNFQGVSWSGQSYSNNAPYTQPADPYSIPQIGQPISYTYSGESATSTVHPTQGSTHLDHSSVQQPPIFYPEPSSRSEEIHYSTNHQQLERSSQPDIHRNNSSVSSWHERPSCSQSPQVSKNLSSILSLSKHDKNYLDLDERKLKALSFLRDNHEREWEAYKKLLKTQPNYVEEQTNFIRSKVKNILDGGHKPKMDIILKDWEDYWENRMVQLSEDSWATKREDCIAALNSDHKRSRYSDSFVSRRSSESSVDGYSDSSGSFDSKDHRRFRKSKYRKGVRRQEKSSSTLDRRRAGIKERRYSDSSCQSDFSVSDVYTKGKKRTYSPSEGKVDIMRKRKQHHSDRKRKEMSYTPPSDRESERVRKGQSFSPRYHHSSLNKEGQESCSYDRTRMKDQENYRVNSLKLDDKKSSISKENSTSGNHSDLAILEYIMKVKNSSSSQISSSEVYGSANFQNKQAEISVSEFVAGEWMKTSLCNSKISGDSKNDEGSKKHSMPSSSISNRNSESNINLFVKTNIHSQNKTSELYPKYQKLGPESISKLPKGNETVLSSSKKSCNLLEVFEVLNRFSDDLGNLKRPLELLYYKSLHINSAGMDPASLLYDNDNLTLMHMISSKLKKSVKSADLSIIQSVVIEEALERLDSFLETSLPEVNVKGIAVECLGRSDEKIREYITKELIKASDFPITENQLSMVLKNVKEEQLKLFDILKFSKCQNAK